MMIETSPEWEYWARFLQRNHLTGLFSFILTAGSPLTILFTQIFYLLDPFIPGKHFQAFGKILENPRNSEFFLDFLQSKSKNE
jgi:hypothetical protein